MPNCKHCHQPQTAAQVICPECYRALTERTVSMETDKLIEALRKGCLDCPHKSTCKDNAHCKLNQLAADKLEKLNDFEQSQCAKLLAQLAEKDKQLAAAVEDIRSPSVCERCVRCSGCQGDDICIDNGYMNFEWRGHKRPGR